VGHLPPGLPSILHGVMILHDLPEAFGVLDSVISEGAAAALEQLSLATGPGALLALIGGLILTLTNALETGERIAKKQGICYGMVLAVAQMPDPAPPSWWGSYASERAREFSVTAWYDGLTQGRAAAAQDAAVWNRLLLVIAANRPQGQAHVLNILWSHAKEGDHDLSGFADLPWPPG
jgi:hypothetical protein